MPKFVMSKYSDRTSLMAAREDFITRNHLSYAKDDGEELRAFKVGTNEAIHQVAFNLNPESIKTSRDDHTFTKSYARGFNAIVETYPQKAISYRTKLRRIS